MEAGYLSQ